MMAWHRQPFVGRTAELAALDEALADAAQGQLRAMVVAGDAGVGKSRLMAEFLSRQPQARGIVTHCLEIGPEGLPFAPFAGLLRALVGELGRQRIAELVGDGIVELARLSPDLGPPGPETRWGKGRLFEAFARLLESLPGAEPTILVIEDIHWADAATRDLLRFVAATVTGRPLLILATYRTDELPRHHPLRSWLAEYERSYRVARLDLPPLSPDEVAALLAGRELPAAAVSDIVALSQGIPFYAEELGEAYSAGRSYLPSALRNALTARTSRLSEPARRVVAVAAAAMSPTSHEVLAAVTGQGDAELDTAVAEAVESGILTVDSRGRYAFRHALTREALVDDLLPGRRVAGSAFIRPTPRRCSAAAPDGRPRSPSTGRRRATTRRPPGGVWQPPTMPPRSMRVRRSCVTSSGSWSCRWTCGRGVLTPVRICWRGRPRRPPTPGSTSARRICSATRCRRSARRIRNASSR